MSSMVSLVRAVGLYLVFAWRAFVPQQSLARGGPGLGGRSPCALAVVDRLKSVGQGKDGRWSNRVLPLSLQQSRPCMSTLIPGREPLTDAELERLGGFLSGLKNPQRLTLEGLDGFFCALVAGPDLVLPSEYLPVVWGGGMADEDAFPSEAVANEQLGLMMQHWNSIIDEFERETVYVPLFDVPDEQGVPGRRWAQGFMRGVALRRRAWVSMFQDQNEGQLLAIPLVAGEMGAEWPEAPLTDEQCENIEAYMAAGAGRAYRRFSAHRRAGARATREAQTVRREVPKVGRNDPCPCGSGRKFKQCCGASGGPLH